MLIEKVKTLSNLDRLCYWIKEREAIREKKEAGEQKPWTDDVILQSYRFCNVVRADDKVSGWLVENWYKPNKGHPNMLTACVLARQFNKIETLTDLGFPLEWNPRRMLILLNGRTNRGLKNFNGAYVITGQLAVGTPKIEQVVNLVVTPIHKAKPKLDFTSMAETHTALMGFDGLGPFIAGQVTADLRLAIPEEDKWLDRLTWAPIGPGSRRGMNRLLSLPLKSGMTQSVFSKHLTSLRVRLRSKIPADLYCRMEAMDLQNSLCEFDKMERTLWENRRPKQLYKGVE